MDKKKVLLFSILGVLLIGIAISFAYWQVTLQQENPNVVTSECFQINFTDGEGIRINDAHPVSEEEGLTSTPYDFTITNVCNSRASYQINLETLVPSGKQLPDKYLKVNVMEDTTSMITTKLFNEIEVEPTIEGAVKAYRLLSGILNPEEEKSFSLRIWMHEEVTTSDVDSMEATYEGKVSIITSYYKQPTIALGGKEIPVISNGNGLYEVSHKDAEIIYTEDTELQNKLKQTEYRYAGANPNNYVKFNNELWRVIGLVNTPEGQRIKIIRNESIGSYSWDTSEITVNNGYGVNEWSQSKMMDLLNHGPYYHRTSGTCYNGRNNIATECDFSSTGLLEESKSMIDTITWNLGSNDGIAYTEDNISTINFYNLERSNNLGKICTSGDSCNDSVERNITWTGQIGLMYPSDYGYATSGGNDISREICLSRELNEWQRSLVDCRENDWLYNGATMEWTLSANAAELSSFRVFSTYYGGVFPVIAPAPAFTRPSLYLQSNVTFISGNGTIDTPYELNA